MYKQLLIAAPILLALDYLYLTANRAFFERQIISVQKFAMKIKMIGVIVCYIFILFGLYYFILKPHRRPLDAFILGVVIYGIYETTSYATLKNWKPETVVLDTLWGGVLFYLTTWLTYTIQGF
jgi:uncharacterized membrane protein